PGPPPTVLYTLSLPDALPIYSLGVEPFCSFGSDLPICSVAIFIALGPVLGDNTKSVPFFVNSQEVFTAAISSLVYRNLPARSSQDRKSTRLNSSHVKISYAVF